MSHVWILLLCTLPHVTALSLTSSVEEAGRHAACPGEEVVFTCSVSQARILQWDSDSFPPGGDLVRFTVSSMTGGSIFRGEFQANLTSLTNTNGSLADMTSTLTVVANDTSLNGTVVNCTELTDFTEQITTESRRLHIAALPSPPRSPSYFLQSHTDDSPTVSVRWEQPESDGWARIKDFIIIMTGRIISVSGNITMAVLPTSLPYNQNITVLITASNCAGESGNAELIFTIVDCGTPIPPQNGSVNATNGTTQGSEVVFVCDAGLVPSQQMTAVCGEDRMWDPNPASLTCLADCGDPSPPINGVLLSHNSTFEGSVVVFSCEEGFLPEGRITGVCAENGSWTPDPATFNCTELTPGTEPDSTSGSGSNTGVIAAIVIVLVVVASTAAVIAVLGVLYLKKYRRKYYPSQPQPITSNGSDHDVEMYTFVKEDDQDSKPTQYLGGVSYDEVNLDSRGGPPLKVAGSHYADLNPGPGGVAPPKADAVEYSSLLTPQPTTPQEPVHPADKKLNINSVLIQLREVHDYWYQLGEALGVPTSILDDVSTLCITPQDSMVEVIDFWLRSHTGQPTWTEVSDALREVNLTYLSQSIRQVYTTGTLPVVVDERAPLPLPNTKEDTPPPLPARGGDSPELPILPPKPTRVPRTSKRQRPPVPPKSDNLTSDRRAPPRPPKQPASDKPPPPRPPKPTPH